jgi:hypothetical protein
VRRRFLNTPSEALALVRAEKRGLYYIAQIPMRELRQLGLSLVPDPVPEVLGHSVVPQLNSTEYPKDKPRWKDMQKALAEIASRNIVHCPVTDSAQPS